MFVAADPTEPILGDSKWLLGVVKDPTGLTSPTSLLLQDPPPGWKLV